ALGDADYITAGSNNIILGGYGDDQITLGGGTAVVLGDNGVVRRYGVTAGDANDGFQSLADVYMVDTTDTTAATGGNDTIASNGGENVILGGVGSDFITAGAGTDNIVLGDNGVVNMNQVGADADNIQSSPCADGTYTCASPVGAGDTIIAGSNNIILGGVGQDQITLGGGTAVVLGDNGTVRRTGALDTHGNLQTTVTSVETSDVEQATGDADTIVSNGGQNVILGGVGGDTISANFGSQNIILGDNGVVNLDNADSNDISSTEPGLGGDDTIQAGTSFFDPATAIEADNQTIELGYVDGLVTGQQVTYDNGGGTSIGGLVNGATYYVIVVSATEVKLATTSLNALAGHAIALTAPVGGGTAQELIPSGLAGSGSTTGVTSNIIIGGFGHDTITLGSGYAVVLGDNGIVRRVGGDIGFGDLADVVQVATTDTTDATGGPDTITSNGGQNVILGGVGGDTINADQGSQNIILGDDGTVGLGYLGSYDISSELSLLGGDDTINAVLADVQATSNIIIGGFGHDTITLGSGYAVVLGDNGTVTRPTITGDGFGHLADVTRVATTDLSEATGGPDTIISNGGENVIVGGVGSDTINASNGSDNIILGDDGVVNMNQTTGNDIYSDVAGDSYTGTDDAGDLGNADMIFAGSNNIIIGGYGSDVINLGGGYAIVLGDNGVVRRYGVTPGNANNGFQSLSAVYLVETTDTTEATGGKDQITSTGGENVILGGVGSDTITANPGSDENIILGDDGVVNMNQTAGNDIYTDVAGDSYTGHDDPGALGDADTITAGSNNIILGGYGADQITLGGGTAVVLGDNGVVRRYGVTPGNANDGFQTLAAVYLVATTDTTEATGAGDTITSNG